MGLYRDFNGNVVEADDALASARQLTPVTPGEEAEIYTKRGEQQRLDEGSTALSTAKAIGSRALSSATLGASDVLLDGLMSPAEREQLQADLAAHPYASALAEGAGALVPALAAPESLLGRTPAGYLANLAAPGIEAGLAEGGAAGVSKALLGMGAEGATQAAGQYIGQTAIADKEVTAEGFAGALGTGFVFGAAGGGAALGVAEGTIAARRLFSRVMDGEKAAADAASAWSLASQSALEAEQATTATLQARKDEISKQITEALRYRNEMKSSLEEERIAASTAQPRPPGAAPSAEAPFEGPVPLDDGISGPQGGGQTAVFQRPVSGEINPADAAAFDASLPTPGEGPTPLDAGIAPARGGGQTSVFKRPAETLATDLEQKLAGTKAELDAGKSLKDVGEKAAPGSAVSPQIPPGKTPPKYEGRNPSTEIEKMLAEKAKSDLPYDKRYGIEVPKPREIKNGFDPYAEAEAGRLRQNNPAPPEYGPTSRQRFGNLRTQLAQKLLPEIREAQITELLGSEIAKEDRRLTELLDNVAASRSAMTEAMVKDPVVPLDFARGRSTSPATPEEIRALQADRGTGVASKRAVAALDSAHEEALLQAQSAADPDAAAALMLRADDLENILTKLTPEEPTKQPVPLDFLKKIERYEKDIAAVVDEAGDAAHPVAKEIADAVRKAENDSERKIIDRTARAADDAETFGPEYKSPKERVAYARDQVRGAQDKLNELKVQHTETKDQLDISRRKVREGEKAKKAALRTDAQVAKAATVGSKAMDIGGMLEVFDIPGLPKPHDLPVIGPLVGAYLKYRTLKKALGRAMGRVPATGTAKVATLASRTRDRIAKAVDVSLKVASPTARTSARYVAVQTALLGQRIFDDGLPDAKKNASLPEQAATRIRELSNYVNTPGAIEKDVLRQMVDVADPDLIAAAEQHRRATMEYLLSAAPKGPDQGMMQTVKWLPSPAEAMSFARRLDAVNDPAGVWERFAQQHALLSLESAEALRAVYPQLFSQAQQRVVEQLAYLKNQAELPPLRQRLQMSLFYQMPLDSALEPANLKISQSVYERKMIAPAPTPTQPPTPSIAQPTNMTALFTNPLDRMR